MKTLRTAAAISLAAVATLILPARNTLAQDAASPLQIRWKDRTLSIRSDQLAQPIEVWYLEAYCRPGSTDRDWNQTIIPHTSELLRANEVGTELLLEDRLDDGVIVEHTIHTSPNAVEFRVVAQNPTNSPSLVDWAQPCLRVARFAGARTDDFREVYPDYIRKCFLIVDNKPTMLPTTPWASEARYVPGQVYCPANVDRNDVNPRPLSKLVPSAGLCGCISADGKQIVAMAWEPYQEIFQGVIGCMHTDFRIGGLAPGERKVIRGKIYITGDGMESLQDQYRRDFQ